MHIYVCMYRYMCIYIYVLQSRLGPKWIDDSSAHVNTPHCLGLLNVSAPR